MDRQDMQLRLRAKGIQVPDGDPAFTLLALNDVVLERVTVWTQERVVGCGAERLETQKMQSLLLAKGIRLADDDPLFTLLALNEVALEEMGKQYRKTLAKRAQSWQQNEGVYLKVAMCSLLAFTLGTMVKGDLSWLRGICLVAAIVIMGWLIYLLDGVAPGQKPIAGDSPLSGTSDPEVIAKYWTEEEFQKAESATTPRISARTLEACWRVLVHGDDLTLAAAKNVLLPAQVRRALVQLEKNRPRQ